MDVDEVEDQCGVVLASIFWSVAARLSCVVDRVFNSSQDVKSIPREERVNILMQERPFRYSAGLFFLVDFLVNSRLEMPKTGILKYATRNTQSRD